MPSKEIFPTRIYIEDLKSVKKLNQGLLSDIRVLEKKDEEGIQWSKENYPNGYTSYASLIDLHERFPDFIELRKKIDGHVKKYAKDLKWDLMTGSLEMTVSWVSIMKKNTYHTMHTHPLSVISGTYYIDVPKGAAPIKLEDPRLSYFMNSPPRNKNAREEEKHFLKLPAKIGQLILFESWLRHEVPLHQVDKERITFSFNYEWV